MAETARARCTTVELFLIQMPLDTAAICKDPKLDAHGSLRTTFTIKGGKVVEDKIEIELFAG